MILILSYYHMHMSVLTVILKVGFQGEVYIFLL